MINGDPTCLAVFTGGRDWRHPRIVKLFLLGLHVEYGPRLTVYVGDCETGADQIVRDTCEQLGIDYKPFYAERGADGRWVNDMAGPLRNRRMCEAAAAEPADHKFVMACHDNLDFSKRKGGTKGCCQEARKVNLPVYHLERLYGSLT